MYTRTIIFSWILLICSHSSVARGDTSKVCLKGTYQKPTPGPTTGLYGECSSWEDNSCCTNETAYLSQLSGPGALYNFDYDTCGELSAACKKHFLKESCFYQCSPNVGPWIVNEPSSRRENRLSDVPICESACQSWYEDCKNDLTCKDNWAVGWDWSSGVNKCPPDAKCRPFSEMFTSAKHLCEDIYPGDFKMIPEDDNKPCIVLDFEGSNPNDEVYDYYRINGIIQSIIRKLLNGING